MTAAEIPVYLKGRLQLHLSPLAPFLLPPPTFSAKCQTLVQRKELGDLTLCLSLFQGCQVCLGDLYGFVLLCHSLVPSGHTDCGVAATFDKKLARLPYFLSPMPHQSIFTAFTLFK